MTFNEKLRERKALCSDTDWNKDAMPEVYQYRNEYLKTGQYGYHTKVVEYICQHEQVDSDLMEYLKTEVYFASKQLDREQEAQHKAKMLTDGWLELTPEAIKIEAQHGHKIMVNATKEGAIFTSEIDSIFKPVVSPDGQCYLMKPRATRKGLPVAYLDNAFYKVLA